MSDERNNPQGLAQGEDTVDAVIAADPGEAQAADEAEAADMEAGAAFDEDFSRPAETATPSKTRFMKDGGSRRLLLFAGAVVVLLVGTAFWLSSGRQVVEETSVVRAPRLDSTPGGARQAESPRYQETLQQSNAEQAEAARAGGSTFIPTVDTVPETIGAGRDEDIGGDGDFAARPRQEVIPPSTIRTRVEIPETPRPARAAPGEKKENPNIDRIRNQMGLMMQAWAPKSAGVTVLSQPSRNAGGAGTTAGPAAAATGPVEAPQPVVVAQAGSIVYAHMVNSVNSDVASPVLAEIDTGLLKGSRIMGTFTPVPASDGLAVQFSSLVMADGKSTPVSAYAMDGVTAQSLVASNVDRRILARYGPVFAAAFISGAAKAFADTGTQIADIGGNAVVTRPEANLEQALAAGVANAGSTIAGDIAASRPRGPKISLESGYPVAIMFMQPVLQQADASPPAVQDEARPAARNAARLAVPSASGMLPSVPGAARQVSQAGYPFGNGGLEIYPRNDRAGAVILRTGGMAGDPETLVIQPGTGETEAGADDDGEGEIEAAAGE